MTKSHMVPLIVCLLSFTANSAVCQVTPVNAECSGYLTTNGSRIYYDTHGQGPVLDIILDGLVHADVWENQITTFMELNIDHATLIRSSSGGGLAIDFTISHPEKVDALVLVGAVVDGLGYSSHFMKRVYSVLSPDNQATINRMVNDQYHIAPQNTSAFEPYEDLYHLLKFLNIDKAHVKELSMGGRIAIDFSFLHPYMVWSLLPVSPGLSCYQFTPQEMLQNMQ